MRHVVDEDGARAALGAIAADLGSGELQMIAQELEQRPVVLYFDSLTNNSSLNWKLTGPAGSATDSSPITFTGSEYPNPLSVPAGDYTLTGATGSVTITPTSCGPRHA